MKKGTLGWAAAGLLVVGGIAAWAPSAIAAATASPPATATATATASMDNEATAAPKPAKVGHRASWLKVRVVEQKDGKSQERVAVTVPLALLAVLGDDANVDLSELGVKGLKNAKSVRIMDVIDTFEPGSKLLEVTDDDSHVTVWVE
jgi:hypothetical protein